MDEHLLLKWGTLKGWRVVSDASTAALREYHEAGETSISAMAQRDNDAQKDALCRLIDAIQGPITSDWTGEAFTPEQAKAYVREYRRG